MLDTKKLRGKLVEQGFTIETMAKALEINPSTFYRKMKQNTFNIREADIIAKKLELSADEINSIFFSQLVA